MVMAIKVTVMQLLIHTLLRVIMVMVIKVTVIQLLIRHTLLLLMAIHKLLTLHTAVTLQPVIHHTVVIHLTVIPVHLTLVIPVSICILSPTNVFTCHHMLRLWIVMFAFASMFSVYSVLAMGSHNLLAS